MAGVLDRYNPEVLAVECPHCGAEPFQRCKNQITTRPIPPHSKRVKAGEDAARASQ